MSRTFNAHTTKIKNAVTGAWDTPVTVKGKSAYEAAVEAGLFSGTEEEYNNFIKNQRESSIQAVRDEGIISLSECDKSEKEYVRIFIKASEINLYYKMEIKIEFLTACYSCLSSIKVILVCLVIVFMI